KTHSSRRMVRVPSRSRVSNLGPAAYVVAGAILLALGLFELLDIDGSNFTASRGRGTPTPPGTPARSRREHGRQAGGHRHGAERHHRARTAPVDGAPTRI